MLQRYGLTIDPSSTFMHSITDSWVPVDRQMEKEREEKTWANIIKMAQDGKHNLLPPKHEAEQAVISSDLHMYRTLDPVTFSSWFPSSSSPSTSTSSSSLLEKRPPGASRSILLEISLEAVGSKCCCWSVLQSICRQVSLETGLIPGHSMSGRTAVVREIWRKISQFTFLVRNPVPQVTLHSLHSPLTNLTGSTRNVPVSPRFNNRMYRKSIDDGMPRNEGETYVGSFGVSGDDCSSDDWVPIAWSR